MSAPALDAGSRPAVGPGFRLQWEPAQESHVLLYPEGMVKLSQSAGEIVKRCDGTRSVAAIVADLEQAFGTRGLEAEVHAFIEIAGRQRWLVWGVTAMTESIPMRSPTMPGAADAPTAVPRPGPPLWLLAELTYRCPLHCVFCYNPVDFARQSDELSTADWLRVLRQGREMGAVQLGLSGGEPLLREDLEDIVAEARRLGYYSNLLTSGVGLTAARAARLKQAGLDHVQLSFQDSTRELNDFLSHTRTFELKQRVAGYIREQGWPMVMNVVVHRLNIDNLDRIIAMAHELGAEYLEIANTQYYSWAFVNRSQLLPTHEQLRRAEQVTNEWRARLDGGMRLFFVAPDYHEGRAKKCVNGWGSMFLTVAPDGTALPCHTARMLPGLAFPNVRDMTMRDIWFDSEGFNRYRGTGWMKEPCTSCAHKEEDLGGCRCQAYLLASDPAAADPVCRLSPDHGVVQAAVAAAHAPTPTVHPLVFRDPANSRRLSQPAG